MQIQPSIPLYMEDFALAMLHELYLNHVSTAKMHVIKCECLIAVCLPYRSFNCANKAIIKSICFRKFLKT